MSEPLGETAQQPARSAVARPSYLQPVSAGVTNAQPEPEKRVRRWVKRKANATDFFKEPLPHSKIKTDIVASYFGSWSNIIKTRTRSGRMCYVDLYAGKGVYDDGTPSTPIRIIEKIIADPVLRDQMMIFLADESAECIGALRQNVAALTGIETLKHAPNIEAQSAKDSGLDKHFEVDSIVPSFLFLDPFGYEGVTAKLIRSVLKDFGCDVVFFFCFRRMPGAIRNPKVRAHMDELFGKEGVDALRELLPTLKTPAEREQAILTALEASMNSIGGRYVQTFRFRDEHNNVSHHLVFVTKNATAHFIMKQIMAKHSSGFVDEVANFEFISNAQPALFATDAPIETLMDDLLKRFRGQTISIEKIMEEHQYGTPYIPRNYQEALRRLCYDRKLIKAVRGPHSPVLEPEKRHMPVQNTYITFP